MKFLKWLSKNDEHLSKTLAILVVLAIVLTVIAVSGAREW